MSAVDPDPLQAARKIAKVLLGLVEPETAQLLATRAAEMGEPWLYECWRDHLDPQGSNATILRMPVRPVDWSL